MFQVRHGIFETNSSSMHSLTFISDEEMEAFKCGELLFDTWGDVLVTREEAEMVERGRVNYSGERFYNYDNLSELGYYYGGEAYCSTATLPDGHHANYICYYGHD